MVSCLLIYFGVLSLYHCYWVCFHRNLFYIRFTTSPAIIGLFRLIEGALVLVAPFIIFGTNMLITSKVMGTIFIAQSFFGKTTWATGWIEFSLFVLDLFMIWVLVSLWTGIDTAWVTKSISDEVPRSAVLQVTDACSEVWVRITVWIETRFPENRNQRRRRNRDDSFYGHLMFAKIIGSALAIAFYFIVPNHSHLIAYFLSGGIASGVCLSAVLTSISSSSGSAMNYFNGLGNRFDDD